MVLALFSVFFYFIFEYSINVTRFVVVLLGIYAVQAISFLNFAITIYNK